MTSPFGEHSPAGLTQPWLSWLHRRSAARLCTLMIVYATLISASYGLGFLVRFEFAVPEDQWALLARLLAPLVLLQLVLLALFGQFGTLLSYFSLPDAERIGYAALSNAGVLIGIWYLTTGVYSPPRSVILMGMIFTTAGIVAVRVTLRRLRESPPLQARSYEPQRICIVGAGAAGARLAHEMLAKPHLRMTPAAFFDDDETKKGSRLHGVPILGRPEKISAPHPPFDKAIIALPTAPAKRIREVVQLMTTAGLKSEIVPSLDQLINGTVRVSQIRPVDIQDLLGRPAVNLADDRLRNMIRDRTVLVTGAGGSIGGELCRQIAAQGPRALVLVERSEFLLFQIEQELQSLGYGALIVPLVADILDENRIDSVFARHAPSIVFHAAAHKHVPMMEHQPAEAFRNNTIGTRRLARLAMQHGVERFVFISTDKAINPTNVMGATKRLAELYLQALQPHSPGTKFTAVRFGNVLGSSGSVIPTFKKQIAAGGPVTVTHPDVTRYFMTVHEAVGLVLQSATLGDAGEIFVLDMGEPMKIVDLARQLILLSGLQPDIDVEIQFTGLRPGEKLYEELNHNTENHHPTEHPRIMRFVGAPTGLTDLDHKLIELHAQSLALSTTDMKRQLKQLLPEYHPYFGPR